MTKKFIKVLVAVGASVALLGTSACQSGSLANTGGAATGSAGAKVTIKFLNTNDKTQIAVAGLGSTASATATWVGATLALSVTSILGVFAGRHLLNRLPLRWIHRISGVFFLLLALLAALHLLGIF